MQPSGKRIGVVEREAMAQSACVCLPFTRSMNCCRIWIFDYRFNHNGRPRNKVNGCMPAISFRFWFHLLSILFRFVSWSILVFCCIFCVSFFIWQFLFFVFLYIFYFSSDFFVSFTRDFFLLHLLSPICYTSFCFFLILFKFHSHFCFL